ncbi:10666_t:CDS:2 [Entrophospora sp. SA101]|nr:10666_t:CDS:2 [Entrophospora sp. SA101]
MYYEENPNPQALQSQKRKQQQKKILLVLLLLAAGTYYYFMVYLPEQKIKALEDELQGQLDRVKNAKQDDSDKEVRKISNVLVGRYNEDAKSFPDGDQNKDFHFSRAGGYDIYFPPSLKEFYEMGEKANQSCKPNPATKKDNNAIFFGAPGTGKTATVKKICIEADECPLVILKGSSLTPTKQDYDAGIAPLQKFVYTISELEWKLVKTYGFERETNGEIRYILFVDECDQISNNSLIHDPNKLRFLKELLEGKFKKYFDDAGKNPQKYKLPSGFNIPSLPQQKFISNNPDGILKEEIEAEDENGNKSTETEETEIEIGEFLQFFWQTKESGQLANYDGGFESPRIPKEAEVLNDNLPNLGGIVDMLAQSSNALNTNLENLGQRVEGLQQQIQTAAMNSQNNNVGTVILTAGAAVLTGGASIGIQAACIGGAFLVGASIDADKKKRENENKQLNLKSEVSKEIRDEINNLQDERSQLASQQNTIDQQVAQKQNRLNDPNVSEHEKAQIRSEIAALMSSRSSVEQQIKSLDDKINALLKNAQQTITGGGGLANLEIDYQTKLIIAAVVFLVIYFLLIKDKDR